MSTTSKKLIEQLRALTNAKVILKEFFLTGKDIATGKALKNNLWRLFYEGYVDIEDDPQLENYIKAEWLPEIQPLIKAIPNDIQIQAQNETDINMPTLWLETTDAFEAAHEGDYSEINTVLRELRGWLIEFVNEHGNKK